MSDKKKVLVSISGGETSGLMAINLWKYHQDEYEMVFVFANTSREKEKTLIFLNNIEKHFNIPIVWIEAVVHHGSRKSSTHRIISFETACRNGDVFEEVIKKYGIPCAKAAHCTRELKTNPIKDYARSIGWINYYVAIGYRRDEPKRVNLIKAAQRKHFYPLWIEGIKKFDVKKFWAEQPFQLGLEEWEGNCIMCVKKSVRKSYLQVLAEPGIIIWHYIMELKYRIFKKKGKLREFNFFRDNRTCKDIVVEAVQYAKDNPKYYDISPMVLQFEPDLDLQEDCSESCEAFS
jgi:hypothetical protein